MAERPDQIERHIESTRHELGNNLQELQHKVKQATDWKTYYERNPMMMVGLALGGGVLLASMLGGKSSANPIVSTTPRETRPFNRAPQPSQVNDTIETLKSALIGVTASRVRNLLNDLLPGFSEQYEKVERRGPAYASPQNGREFETPVHRM